MQRLGARKVATQPVGARQLCDGTDLEESIATPPVGLSRLRTLRYRLLPVAIAESQDIGADGDAGRIPVSNLGEIATPPVRHVQGFEEKAALDRRLGQARFRQLPLEPGRGIAR